MHVKVLVSLLVTIFIPVPKIINVATKTLKNLFLEKIETIKKILTNK